MSFHDETVMTQSHTYRSPLSLPSLLKPLTNHPFLQHAPPPPSLHSRIHHKPRPLPRPPLPPPLHALHPLPRLLPNLLPPLPSRRLHLPLLNPLPAHPPPLPALLPPNHKLLHPRFSSHMGLDA